MPYSAKGDHHQSPSPADFVREIDDNRLFNFQSHLHNPDGIDLNVLPVYVDYTGAGVSIAIADESIDARHSDLAPNYDSDADFDFVYLDADATQSDSDSHGTAVAAVAAGANDDEGVVGVAFDASIAGLRVMSTGPSGGRNGYDVVADALRAGVNFDVVNNSYSFAQFADGFHGSAGRMETALEMGVANGRDGLGSVYVFAAGNGRALGDDVSASNLQSARQTIAVAATDKDGLITSFSTPGAAVLVSAQGQSVVTADALGEDGYLSSDYVAVAGTSFSSPIVSGVVALILEANPRLGYRDVQQILAISARNTDPNGGFQSNGADVVNGGGLQFSHDYGFGVVDATAAVRLAETWTETSTAENEAVVRVEGLPGLDLPESAFGPVSASQSFFVSENIRVQHVELDVALTHPNLDELTLRLINPDGAVSTIFDSGHSVGTGAGAYTFRLNSVAHLYEESAGEWRIEAIDADGSQNHGAIFSVDVRFYGDAITEDDTYYYTDDFALLADNPDRRRLDDSGGVDTINLAAVSSASQVDLSGGVFTVAGFEVEIAEGAAIENVVLGDGDDEAIGSALDNALWGGRGNDLLRGEGGDDLLTGGAGDDFVIGGAGLDIAAFRGEWAAFSIDVSATGVIRVAHSDTDGLTFGAMDGVDTLEGVELLRFVDRDVDAVALIEAANGETPGSDAPGSDNPGDTPSDAPAQDEPPADDTPPATDVRERREKQVLEGDGEDNTIVGDRGLDVVRAFGGDDIIRVFGGDDRLNGGGGSDWLNGGAGDDLMLGGGGDDRLVGGDGADQLYGGSGADRLHGRSGDDLLVGGLGDDRLIGGGGSDTFVFEEEFGHDRIVDFDPLVDRLDLSRAVSSISDLQFDAVGAGVRMTLDDDNHVTFVGRSLADVVDFTFI